MSVWLVKLSVIYQQIPVWLVQQSVIHIERLIKRCLFSPLCWHLPSTLEKMTALISRSRAWQACELAYSGNLDLKTLRHSKASWTQPNSWRQRAIRKWAFMWLGSMHKASWQSLKAANRSPSLFTDPDSRFWVTTQIKDGISILNGC